MTVHLFGATSSPGCANFGFKRIAEDFQDEFGLEAAEFICRDFYVDDGLKSVSNVDEAISLIDNTKSRCEKADLRLHKFVSNIFCRYFKLCFYLVPSIMTDCFQITVPGENEEFYILMVTIIFQGMGTMCNVISCPTMTFFSTYAKHMEHFIKTHRRHLHIYKCISCGRMFQKKDKQAHLNAHGMSGANLSKFNPTYLAPGDCPLALPSRQKPSNINENELRSYKRVSVANKREYYKTYMSRRLSSFQILQEFENQAFYDLFNYSVCMSIRINEMGMY